MARRIFLGCSTDAATLWDVPNPPSGIPAWFPDFLEAVAGQRVGKAGEYLPAPVGTFFELRARCVVWREGLLRSLGPVVFGPGAANGQTDGFSVVFGCFGIGLKRILSKVCEVSG